MSERGCADMTDYEKAICSGKLHKIIEQVSPDGVKYLIDELTGRYIKLNGDMPVAAGKFSAGYISMAANRATMGNKGFEAHFINNESFEAIFYDLYERLIGE